VPELPDDEDGALGAGAGALGAGAGALGAGAGALGAGAGALGAEALVGDAPAVPADGLDEAGEALAGAAAGAPSRVGRE
jgi:hypothetical protein